MQRDLHEVERNTKKAGQKGREEGAQTLSEGKEQSPNRLRAESPGIIIQKLKTKRQ